MDIPKDKGFQPEDVDLLIKHYGKPMEQARKDALMAKLEAQKEKFIAAHYEQEQSQDRDQGRSR